jgi:hypothetical protein
MLSRSIGVPYCGDILQRRPNTRFMLYNVGWSSVKKCWLFIEFEGADEDSAYNFNIVAIEDGRHARMLSHSMRLPWTRISKPRPPSHERCIAYGCFGDRLLIMSNSVRYHLREGGVVYDGSLRGWSLIPSKFNYNMCYSDRYGWIMDHFSWDGPTKIFGSLFHCDGYFTQTLLCVLDVVEQNYYVMFSGVDSLLFIEHFPGPEGPGYTYELLEEYSFNLWVYSIERSSFQTYVYDGNFCAWFWCDSLEQGCHFHCHDGGMVMISREHFGDDLTFCYHLYRVVLHEDSYLWSLGSRYFTYPTCGYTDAELDWSFSLVSKDLSILVNHVGGGSEIIFFSAPIEAPPSLWSSARRIMHSVKDKYCASDFGGYVGRVIDNVSRLQM